MINNIIIIKEKEKKDIVIVSPVQINSYINIDVVETISSLTIISDDTLIDVKNNIKNLKIDNMGLTNVVKTIID